MYYCIYNITTITTTTTIYYYYYYVLLPLLHTTTTTTYTTTIYYVLLLLYILLPLLLLLLVLLLLLLLFKKRTICILAAIEPRSQCVLTLSIEPVRCFERLIFVLLRTSRCFYLDLRMLSLRVLLLRTTVVYCQLQVDCS